VNNMEGEYDFSKATKGKLFNERSEFHRPIELTLYEEQIIVNAIVKECPNYLAIYIFGSYASKAATPNSDIDIAVLLNQAAAPEQIQAISDTIMLALKKDIDLIDLQAADNILNMQVLSKGIELSVKDRLQSDLYAAHKYTEYAYFNEQRMELLNSIKRRGSIYG
jgi:predicted nucleotidyltransferase